MGEPIQHRKLAYSLGVSEKSLIDWIKEGRFPTGTEKRHTDTLSHYYVDSEDPVLADVRNVVASGDLPAGLEWMGPKKARKSRKKKDAKPEPEPGPPAFPTAPAPEAKARVELESEVAVQRKKGLTKVHRNYGLKQAFRTKIYELGNDFKEVFRAAFPGVVEVEALQEKFPSGGDFLLKVFRRVQDGNGNPGWEYDPALSRDDPETPVSVGPSPGYAGDVDDGEPGALPGTDPRALEDHRFMIDQARKGVDGNGHRGIGPEFFSGISSMMDRVATGQTNAMQGVVTSTQEMFNRVILLMQEESKLRDNEWTNRLDYIEKKGDADLQRMKDERKDDLERLREEKKLELAAIEKKAELERQKAEEDHKREMEREKQYLEQRGKLDKEALDSRITLSDERVNLVVEKLEMMLKMNDDRFEERKGYLDELHKLRMNQVPGQVWSDLFKGLGTQIQVAIPEVLSALRGDTSAPLPPPAPPRPDPARIGSVPDEKPEDEKPAAGEAPRPPKEENADMGAWTLSRIKGHEMGKQILTDIVMDFTETVRNDEPVSMFCTNLLGIAQTEKAFGLILNQIYRNPLEAIAKGLVPDDALQVLHSEKAHVYWEEVRRTIKAYFAQIERNIKEAAATAGEPS